jgi:membrane protein implicated in regulation of membrane protease activity
MSESTIWWLLAGGLVALELVTGTFYLLMLAIGVVAAAIGAHAGLSTTYQIVVAAVVGGGAVAWWHFRPARSRGKPSAQANPDVNLDIGETVVVNAWQADGTAQVQYRGAQWTAIHRTGITPSVGSHRIAEVIGSRLLVDKS